jgi:hypothetical protein
MPWSQNARTNKTDFFPSLFRIGFIVMADIEPILV